MARQTAVVAVRAAQLSQFHDSAVTAKHRETVTKT
jgi:hypothetical protein